jgi:hypothetical protein
MQPDIGMVLCKDAVRHACPAYLHYADVQVYEHRHLLAGSLVLAMQSLVYATLVRRPKRNAGSVCMAQHESKG